MFNNLLELLWFNNFKSSINYENTDILKGNICIFFFKYNGESGLR